MRLNSCSNINDFNECGDIDIKVCIFFAYYKISANHEFDVYIFHGLEPIFNNYVKQSYL